MADPHSPHPRISILTPSYGYGRFIGEAVRSCRAQGVDDFFARAGYKPILREEIQESRPFSGGLMQWIFVRA